MRVGTGTTGAMFGLLIVAATAAQAAQTDPPRMTIEGTSTVRDWKCEVTPDVRVTFSPAGPEALLAKEKSVETVDVRVAVARIDCGNGTMDGHLRKALKAAEHPEIIYTLSTYELADAAEGKAVTVQGQLTIAGSVQPATLVLTLIEDESGVLRARGRHEIVMPEFGVKPPSLMLGTMKVGKSVQVVFDVPVER